MSPRASVVLEGVLSRHFVPLALEVHNRSIMTYYQRNPDIIFRQEEDEALLFYPETTETCVINSTGVFIWSLCADKIFKKDIFTKLKDKFDETDPCLVEKDLDQFLEKLSAKKFLLKVE